MFYKDGQLYTESEIRALNPNTSFPIPFIAPSEFEVVFDTPNPATNLQVGVQDGTELDSKGNRVIKWSVRDKTAEELEAERKASVPTQITSRQIRQQLTAIGLRQTVEDLISSSNDYDLKDWWNYSQDFQRSHPILKEMGTQLGMSEDDMDSFFIEASKL